MKIIIAPDSFKGSLTAAQACRAIADGLSRVVPKAEIISIPMADGGEGTVNSLVAATNGQIRQARVCGPLGEEITAQYGILGDDANTKQTAEQTAVIEMAEAAGLTLVPPEKRNPLFTTTYGVGQLILDALDNGCKTLIIGLGGSATNDCGTGMAQALGVKFYDRRGRQITTCITGRLMGQIGAISLESLDSRISRCKFTIAGDVDNPLLGANGAGSVYGPQKGAEAETIEALEANMENIIGHIESATCRKVRNIPGSGAAGGLGAGLLAFCRADIEPGIDIVMRYSRFAERIGSADLIITGEGKIDGTTVCGKVIAGIAAEAQRLGVPVVALAGSLGRDSRKVLDLPAVRAILPICPGPISLDEAMRRGAGLLADAAERAIRLALMF